MKSLTVANIRKAEGFVRRVEFDFKDDGNSFTGWSYKGLPITQLRSDGQTYFCFREDYLNEHSEIPVLFTYDDWMKTEEYRLADKWNGCDELPSFEELAAAGDKIIAKIKELNEKVSKETIDTAPILSKLAEEECYFAMEYAKITCIDLFDEKLSKYDVECLRNDARNIKGYVKQAQNMRNDIKSGKINNRQLRELSQKLVNYGYVSNRTEDCYWVKNFHNIVEEKLDGKKIGGE